MIQKFIFFMNTLFFGVQFGAIPVLGIMLLFSLFRQFTNIESPSFNGLLIVFLGMTLGTIAIFTFFYSRYTTKIKQSNDRYRRSVRTNLLASTNITIVNIKDCLEKLGYTQFKMTKLNHVDFLECVFPKGFYNFPLTAGGNKFYEEKILKIELNNLTGALELQIGPNCWWIPTANTYSTFYYLEKIEKALLENRLIVDN